MTRNIKNNLNAFSNFRAATLTIYAAGAIFLLSPPAQSQALRPTNTSCSADLLCVKVYKQDGIQLVLENYSHKPLSFQLTLYSADLTRKTLNTLKLSGPQTLQLFSLPKSVDDHEQSGWGYEYRIHYGHHSQQHDKEYIYTLPYSPAASYRVTQSHNTISTHHSGNRFAIDWAMPKGTAVHAARAGLVVSVYSAAEKNSGTDRENTATSSTANHVWIEHSDGTIGKYLHLDHNAVYVKEGQTVAVGQLIAAAGNTGNSSGPHLHFSVSALSERSLYKTFNIRFNTEFGPQTMRGNAFYKNVAAKKTR